MQQVWQQYYFSAYNTLKTKTIKWNLNQPRTLFIKLPTKATQKNSCPAYFSISSHLKRKTNSLSVEFEEITLSDKSKIDWLLLTVRSESFIRQLLVFGATWPHPCTSKPPHALSPQANTSMHISTTVTANNRSWTNSHNNIIIKTIILNV